MEITRTRSLTISMGDYESFKTEATVRMEFPDETPPEQVVVAVNDYLDAALADDIADAQALSGNRKSFIHKIPTD